MPKAIPHISLPYDLSFRVVSDVAANVIMQVITSYFMSQLYQHQNSKSRVMVALFRILFN
jgi:hypothetical protein